MKFGVVTEVSTFLVICPHMRDLLRLDQCCPSFGKGKGNIQEKLGGIGDIYTSEIGTVGLVHHPDRQYVSYTLSGIFLSGSNGERLPRLQRHLDCCC